MTPHMEHPIAPSRRPPPLTSGFRKSSFSFSSPALPSSRPVLISPTSPNTRNRFKNYRSNQRYYTIHIPTFSSTVSSNDKFAPSNISLASLSSSPSSIPSTSVSPAPVRDASPSSSKSISFDHSTSILSTSQESVDLCNINISKSTSPSSTPSPSINFYHRKPAATLLPASKTLSPQAFKSLPANIVGKPPAKSHSRSHSASLSVSLYSSKELSSPSSIAAVQELSDTVTPQNGDGNPHRSLGSTSLIRRSTAPASILSIAIHGELKFKLPSPSSISSVDAHTSSDVPKTPSPEESVALSEQDLRLAQFQLAVYFTDHMNVVFSHAINVPTKDECALIIGICKQSPKKAIEHLEIFVRIQRIFESFEDLSTAIEVAEASQCHLDNTTQSELMRFLSEYGINLFEQADSSTNGNSLEYSEKSISYSTKQDDFLQDGSRSERLGEDEVTITMQSSDLDKLMLAAPPLNLLLYHLSIFISVRRTFQNINELVIALNSVQAGAPHVTSQDQSKLMEFLKDSRLFTSEPSVWIPPSPPPSTPVSQSYSISNLPSAFASMASPSLSPVPISSPVNISLPPQHSPANTASSSSFIVHTVPSPSSSEIDSLFSMCGSWETLSQHLNAFHLYGRRFSTFESLISALHNALQTGCYLDDVMVSTIIDYLSSDTCALFDHLQYDIEMSFSHLHQLYAAVGGEGIAALLYYLRSFDRIQRKVDTAEQLIEAVALSKQNKYLVDDSIRLHFARCLCEPMPIAPNPNATGDNGDAKFINDGHVLMFSSVTQVYSQLTPTMLNSLLTISLGVEALHTHLQRFAEVGCTFNSLHELVAAVHLVANGGSYASDNMQRQLLQAVIMLYNNNTSPANGRNKNTIEDSRTNNYQQKLYAQTSPQGSRQTASDLNIPSSSSGNWLLPFQLSNHHIDTLLKAGHGLPATLSLMSFFHYKCFSFPSFESLLNAVHSYAYQSSKVPSVGRHSLLSSLYACANSLFTSPNIAMHSPLLDSLLSLTGSADNALMHLNAFISIGRQFSSLDALIVAVEVALQYGVYLSEEMTSTLMAFFTSNPFLLSATGLASVTPWQLFRLLSQCKGLPSCVCHLQALVSAGRHFDSIDELVGAILLAIVEGTYVSQNDRDEIISHLSALDCHLFDATISATPSVAILPSASNLVQFASDGSIICGITTEAENAIYSPSSNHRHLEASSIQSSPSTSTRSLTSKITSQSIFGTYVNTSIFDASHRKAIIFSSMSACGIILDSAFRSCDNKLEVFIGYCRRYDMLNLSFPDFQALCQHIIAGIRQVSNTSSLLTKADESAFLVYLHHPGTTLFSDALSDSSWSLKITQQELECLIFEGCGMHAAIEYLKRLDSIRRKFNSFGELWPAVHIQWRYGLSSTFEMRQALYQLFCSPPCLSLISQQSPNRNYANAFSPSFSSKNENFPPNSPSPTGEKLNNKLERSKLPAIDSPTNSNQANLNSIVLLTHEELDLLLISGQGLQNTRSHCLRLASMGKTFNSARALADAFFETLTIDQSDEVQIRKLLSNDSCSVWSNLNDEDHSNLFMNLSTAEIARIWYEVGDLSTLEQTLQEFQSRHRTFSTINALYEAICDSINSGSYYPPSVVSELITHLYCTSTLLSPSPIICGPGIPGTLMISGKLADELIMTAGNVDTVISHLQKIESVGRSFKSLEELSTALHEAVELSFHSSAEMRSSILSYLSSTSCDLIDKSRKDWKDNADSVIDLILQISGGLQSALQHFYTFHQLRMRFAHMAQLCPAISQAIRTNVHSTRIMQQAISSYLAAAECKLLQDPNCLTTLNPIEIEDLLLSGGGVLNTLKHLQRLNSCQHQCSSVRELSEALRNARRTRLYYPASTRTALALYLNTIQGLLQKKNETSLPFSISDRDCERLLKYGGGFTSTFHILHDLNAAHKRFHSLLDIFAIIKRIKSYDDRAHTSRRANPNENRKRITVNDRQQVITLLSSTLLFSENESSFTVKSDEVDELINAGGDASTTCLTLRKLNADGRRFIGMGDLTIAVAAIRGPVINFSLESEDRERLLQALSWPQCTLFSESRFPIRITEPELCQLVMLSDNSVDRALHHLSQFSRASRRFSSLPHLLEAIQQSDRTQLYATDEARLFVLDCLQNPACSLFTNRQIAVQLTIVSFEVDQCILTAGNASACVWHLQSMDEGGERFENFPTLLSSSQKSASASPQLFPLRSNSSVVADRNALFQIVSSRECKLFEEADRELSISGLAFDCFLSRVRGLERAKRILRGLEVRQRRFLSFGHLFWSVCKVRDNGQTISDIESWGLEEGFLEVMEEEEEGEEEQEDEDDDDECIDDDGEVEQEMKNNTNKMNRLVENLELKENHQQHPHHLRVVQAAPRATLPPTINTAIAKSKPRELLPPDISPPNTHILIPIVHTNDMINAINEDSNLSSFDSSSLSFTSTSEFSSV